MTNETSTPSTAPGSYADFLHYLDTVTSEKALFSRLTYWFAFRTSPEDVQFRPALVEARAKELKLWNGLELKLERWRQETEDEKRRLGPEQFNTLAGEDYSTWFSACNGGKAGQASGPRLNVYSARELSQMLLAPVRYIVEGVIPMGLGVLVAKPKLGKSWMVLDLCLSVAAGEPFLSFATTQHGALYLALEDGKSRMQKRLNKLLDGQSAPEGLHILFEAPRMDDGLLELLGQYLDSNPDIHLVCIDTLSMVKPKSKPFENAYDADYTYMGALKKFADARGICILLVHHTRKGRSADDSFENINGSTGIMGASDFTIVLDKKQRMGEDASFELTGRDIEQQERVIRFDKARCRWVMQGTAAELAAQRRIDEYESSPIVRTLRILLEQGDGTWTGNSRRLMELGQHYTHEELAPTSQALAKAVAELEPLLWERDAVKHWIKPNPGGGKRHLFRMNRIDNTANAPGSEQLPLQSYSKPTL